MIEEEIISVPDIIPSKVSKSSQGVPDWIKTNIGYWRTGLTSDVEFANSIQWLVGEGIISLGDQMESERIRERSRTLTFDRDSYSLDVVAIITV